MPDLLRGGQLQIANAHPDNSNLSPTQKTCLFTDGNKASVCALMPDCVTRWPVADTILTSVSSRVGKCRHDSVVRVTVGGNGIRRGGQLAAGGSNRSIDSENGDRSAGGRLSVQFDDSFDLQADD